MNNEESHCQLWKEWSDIAQVPSDTAGAYALNYVIYVMLAVLFAGLAGLYVTTLAPYATGSGIPEVRFMYCRVSLSLVPRPAIYR